MNNKLEGRCYPLKTSKKAKQLSIPHQANIRKNYEQIKLCFLNLNCLLKPDHLGFKFK